MKKLSLIFLLLAGCSDHEVLPQRYNAVGVALPPTSITGNSMAKAGPTAAVSGGPNLLGVTGPTSTAAVGRIANGLEGNAPSNQGNFSRALAQVKANLPRVPNPNLAVGYDQVQLLAYAACSDLTTGGTPLMQSIYGVQPNSSITANQTALIEAGMRILDQHVAGLASGGPAAAQLVNVLAGLVTTEAGVGSNTSTIAFMAVCIAASTAGSTLLGI